MSRVAMYLAVEAQRPLNVLGVLEDSKLGVPFRKLFQHWMLLSSQCVKLSHSGALWLEKEIDSNRRREPCGPFVHDQLMRAGFHPNSPLQYFESCNKLIQD
jgi:hypothetical protein